MPNKDPLEEPDRGHIDPLVGKVLSGRYELEALIARGGMGKIYKATQRPLGRPVALKILDIHDDDREFRDRFFLEASLCARLSHPNTIRIYDYGTTDDGIYYIAMEYLEGTSLQRMLAQEAPLEPLRATRIVRQVCGALSEAHDCGIVHRDLKPGNVFLTPHGEDREFVKVLDFGLVKELGKESELSRSGTVLGSPLYISPEQVNGDPVDGRADVYTAGLILYYMLTGQTAFRKGNTLSLLMQQTKARPPAFAETNPKVKVPAALEWLVMRCLEKRPEDRFCSMHELLRALKACEKELRGELTQPLTLELDQGMLVLPEGLEVSTELRMPVEPPPSVGAPVPPDPTLVTGTGRSTARLGIIAGVVGGSAVVGGLVILVVVVLVGLGGLSLWGSGGAPEPEPVPEPIVEAPPPPPEPAAPAIFEARIESTPAGAEVERDGVLLGTTPLLLKIPVGEEWQVEVSAADHEPRSVLLTEATATQAVTLKKKPGRVRTPRPEPKPDPAPVQPEPQPEPTPAPRPGSDIRDPWAKDSP